VIIGGALLPVIVATKSKPTRPVINYIMLLCALLARVALPAMRSEVRVQLRTEFSAADHGITAQLPPGSCSMCNSFQEHQPTFHTQDYTGMEEHVQPLSVVYFDMASLFD